MSRRCGCGDRGPHRGTCADAALGKPRGATAQIASMAGVDPEIAKMFVRKPRAPRAVAAPAEMPRAPIAVDLRDLGPIEDAAVDLRADLAAARTRIDVLERALLGGARQVERLEGEIGRGVVEGDATAARIIAEYEERVGAPPRRLDVLRWAGVYERAALTLRTVAEASDEESEAAE